ncbi:MAG: thiamine ABC transporter substrate-binding protein [Rhodoluna sp.]|nr:thiamine ABC transporter substrate-binding protein [Rhodoluna sp.]
MFRIPKIAYIATAVLLLAGCSAKSNNELVLATHDSVVISKALIGDFEKSSGLKLTIVKAGDAGALTNKLVLTKDDPIADAVYGIDNTFIGKAEDNGVLDKSTVTAIDYADICFNYDVAWFAKHGVAAPTSWEQLTLPAYKNLTVIENPTTSSTGLGFLAATVAQFGEGKWRSFWSSLKANGVKVDAGWEDAYYTDFSGDAGKGDYPIVLSYSSSPADEANTAAILNGCFRQTEYAATLTGSKNPSGAAKLIKWLTELKFQNSMPGSMYVYPVNKDAAIPESWATKAPGATSVLGENLKISQNRESWLKAWAKIFG